MLEFAEKPSIANGKKHVALDITKKEMSIILAPTDLWHLLVIGINIVSISEIYDRDSIKLIKKYNNNKIR